MLNQKLSKEGSMIKIKMRADGFAEKATYTIGAALLVKGAEVVMVKYDLINKTFNAAKSAWGKVAQLFNRDEEVAIKKKSNKK